MSADSCIARSNYTDTCIQTPIGRLIYSPILLHIIQSNTSQRFAIRQSFYDHLVGEGIRHEQSITIVLLRVTDSSDRYLLLIEESKDQFSVIFIYKSFCNLVSRSRCLILVSCSRNGFIQFPTGNRCAGEGKGLSYLQNLRGWIGNGIAFHIAEVDSNLCALKLRVIEDKDI